MLRDLRQRQMTGIQHRSQFSTNVRRRLSGAFNIPPFVQPEAAHAQEVPASVVHETAAVGLWMADIIALRQIH